MTPLLIVCVVFLCAAVLLAPRRWAVLAMLAGLVYLSQRGGLDAFGLRMHPARFLELAGFIRVVAKKEFDGHRLNSLDWAVIVAYTYMTIVFVLRSAFGFGASSGVTMTTPLSKIGELIDALLMYVAWRGLLRNEYDLKWALQRSVLLLIPFVALVSLERLTGANPLVVFGAIPQVWIDEEGGRIRCFGSFSHPSLLGTFGASFALMYAGLVLSNRRSVLGWVGLSLCLAIVVLSASGGPLTMLMVGLLGWVCWPIRMKMRVLRIGIVAALAVLAVIMSKPIWYLPSKFSAVFGGDGWHRSYLMDQAIRHMEQWWFVGMPLDETISWFPYLVHGAADITNAYVAFGVDGGIIAMLLLIRILVRAFGETGRAAKAHRDASPGRKPDELLVWGLGAALAGHAANFLSITYFDQTASLWLFQLAAISGISSRRHADRVVPARLEREQLKPCAGIQARVSSVGRD